MKQAKRAITANDPEPAPAMAIARVRFYDVGDVVALDVNWQPIPGLVYRGPVRKAAPEVKRILAAARAQGGVILQEQAWGRFLPLTENTLAVFEGRAPVGDRTRAVEL